MVLTLLVGTLGCPKPPPDARTDWLGQAFGGAAGGRWLAAEDLEMRALLDQHVDAASQRTALRGAARVRLQGPDFKLNRPQRIAIERPERLRFEVLGLFDVLAAVLASDGETFAFFDASTGKTLRGEMSRDLLWELARLDLDPGEAIEILLGVPRPAPGLEWVASHRSADGRATLLFAAASARCDPAPDTNCPDHGMDSERLFESGVDLLEFDGSGQLNAFESIGFDRKTRVRAVFEDYAETATGSEGMMSALYPMHIRLDSPQVGALADFEWTRVGLATSIPDSVFVLPETRTGRSGGGR